MLLHKRVERGARWMDRRYPGWYDKIDTERLYPNDTRCVIGQVEGSFEDAMDDLRPVTSWILDMGIEHGAFVMALALFWPGTWFAYLFLYGRGFDSLGGTKTQWKNAWTQEIEKRKAVYVPEAWTEASSATAGEGVKSERDHTDLSLQR